jgi:hypothetical protein
MAYKIVRLDRRHKGHNSFRYYVSSQSLYREEKILEFLELRKWAWETFGPGLERDYSSYSPESVWGWHDEYSSPRIYFKDDKELNWFKLRFGV